MADVDNLILRLKNHLLELIEQPSTCSLDTRLLDECDLILPRALAENPPVLQEVISLITNTLSTLTQDPSPLIRLLSKVAEPVSFYDVIHLDPPVDFVQALAPSAEPYHELALQLLRKAAQASKDAAILAGIPSVVFSLVKLWLCASDMVVAARAADVILDLLRVDIEDDEVQAHGFGNGNLLSGGQGLMWRRIFGDKDIYGLLYSIPSLTATGDGSFTKHQKTIAQARLMTLPLGVGKLDWNYFVKSHHPEIEAAYGLKPGEGLLHFLCLYAVDIENDVLIHLNLLQFLAHLISECRQPSPKSPKKSLSLQFLEDYDLHKRAMLYWLQPDDPSIDPVDKSFLYGASAHYIATYAREYPDAFLASDEVKSVLSRLSSSLDLSANHWAHGESPKHDLSVLSSLPRVALLPQRQFGTGRQSSPLFLIPCKVTNDDALNCLRNVFSPIPIKPNPLLSPAVENEQRRDPDPEAQAARALLHAYYAFHESFFADLTGHADTLALPEKALAAFNVLNSIVGHDYPALPGTSTFPETGLPQTDDSLPSEGQLKAGLYPFPTTETYFEPHSLIFLQRPARAEIMHWLLRPPRSFSNLVGGLGDPESAAYRIATAKWDLLRLMNQRLQTPSPGVDPAEQDAAKRAVESRLREGLFATSSEVGGRIATLEL